MKTIYNNFFTAFLLFLSVFTFAQQPEYYANGQIKAEGKYKKDQKIGDWTYYYENGGISLKESYNRKAPNMKTVEYFHPNGKTRATGTIINNLKYETWTWYREDGTKEQFANYMKDNPIGPISYFNKEGVLDKKGVIYNGVMDGEWEHYHPNGFVSLKGVYKKGVAIGEWDAFDEAGICLYTTIYKDEFDAIEYFDPKTNIRAYATNEGKVPYTKNYPNGKPEIVGQKYRGYNDGDWKWFYDNGNLKEEGSFKDTKQHGIWKTYYPNNKLRTVDTISSILKKGVAYHPNGNIKEKKISSSKYGTYYKSGELYMEETMVLGVSLGKKYYNKCGKLIREE